MDFESQMKLMQFLMGLSDVYEAVRNQSLAFDPLTTVQRGFYLVLHVEKQKEVTTLMSGDSNCLDLLLHPRIFLGM